MFDCRGFRGGLRNLPLGSTLCHRRPSRPIDILCHAPIDDLLAN